MSQHKKRVVVTGLGVIAPNGNGLDQFKTAIQEGTSGIRYIQALEDLKFSCRVGGIPQDVEPIKSQYFGEDELLAMNEVMSYAAIAAKDAFDDAGLKPKDLDSNEVYEDTGAILGTGIGGFDTISDSVHPTVTAGKVRRLGSTIVERVMCSSVSAKVGGMLGLGNQVTTNSSACSTGTEAIIMGYQRIISGFARRMMVGGAEGSHPHTWAGFDSMRVLCRKFNDEPERASRPMSASAAGFIPGSGSGVLCIEDLDTALARGAKIYAEIVGVGLTSGGMRAGGSMTAPSPQGVKRCIRMALLEAGLNPNEIDYINGHLTATMADPLEVKNWSEALERGPGQFPKINSTKSLVGHALGASGALESIATLLQMQHGFVHGSLNCEDLHESIAPFGEHVVQKTENADIKVAAKASFGFGDVNSCIIFKKWSPSS